MAEMRLSHDDIDGLARALDGMSLPAPQKDLLSAIVAVVADAVHDGEPTVAVDVDPVPAYLDQFGTAFTPGEVRDLDATARGTVSVKVSRAIKIGR